VVRGLFEYAVIAGVEKTTGASGSAFDRVAAQGPWSAGPYRDAPGADGWPAGPPAAPPSESLEPDEVSAFLADLCTCRDKAMALAMLVGGLRAAEVRSLRLADVDRGMRRVRVVGKGNKERTVPVDRVFFTELGNYLRTERPPGCATPECFVVLRDRHEDRR